MFRGLNVLFTLLFLTAAGVQFNDSDWLSWMAIYLAAAIACALVVLKRAIPWVPRLVGIAAIVWAILLWPRTREVDWTWVEVQREVVGLFLVTLWMFVVAGLGGRTAKS